MKPVALVGMSCRVPGAENPTRLWANLLAGKSSVSRTPEGRWTDAEPAEPASSYGGFLTDPDLFDASFFGISSREATYLDPQQRLLLELAWEAVEDAALPARELDGRLWGVFVGAGSDDFRLRYLMTGHPDRFGHTGTAGCMLAGRLSHHFGLRGPSEVVDTGQSSSLAALHRAMGALHLGECEAAVVAGVAVNLLGEVTEQIRLWGGLSPDGRCHTFDERANGYVRGEGGACVVLKPLEAALRDGDHVYCVIRGTATGNDGDRSGLGAPSAQAQSEVLRAAHRAAGVSAADVSYIELHGTGTPVGDPVEATAIGDAVGRARPDGSPVRVGSVKTNIGHLESAAGIAGLVKAALILHHGRVPPSLHFVRSGPDIDLEAANIRVVTQTEEGGFTDGDVVGVSSFGMGGTHVHAVLGPAPARTEGDVAATPAETLWCLSARSPEAVKELARALLEHPFGAGVGVTDVALALSARTGWEHRAVVVGADWDEITQGLEKVVAGHHFAVPPTRPDTDPAVRGAFVRAAGQYVHSGDIEAARELLPVARAHKAPLLPTYPFRREPFPSPEPAPRPAPPGADSPRPPQPTFTGRWAAARGDTERVWLVRNALELELAAVYGGTVPDFEPEASFSDNGIDSMSLLEFLDRLNTATGLHLSETALFDHPTISELAEYVNKEMEASRV